VLEEEVNSKVNKIEETEDRDRKTSNKVKDIKGTEN